MDAETISHIKDQLFNQKARDYTNLTFFFLIFSIFAFFVIRPSLTTAFSLQVTEETLRETETQYEEVVARIPAIQSALEEIRPDKDLLVQVLPPTPNLNGVLQDIRQSGSASGMLITRMTVNDVNLIGSSAAALKKVTIEVEADSTYNQFIAFQRAIHRQKRLKTITEFEMIKENIQASDSGSLSIKMQIEGYYL